MPSYHQNHQGLPANSITRNEPHGISALHRLRPYAETPSFQQHHGNCSYYPPFDCSLPPTSHFQPVGNFRPPPAFSPISAPVYQAQPQGPPPIPRSVPRSVSMEPGEAISDIRARSDEILAKFSTYISNHGLASLKPSPPAPLQHLTWSQISALEINLLVSIISTLSKLDEAIKTLRLQTLSNCFDPEHLHLQSDSDPHARLNVLSQRLRTAKRRISLLRHPAYLCCETINEVRDGWWINTTKGQNEGGRALRLVVEALERVVGMENSVLFVDGLIEKSEKEWGRWVSTVETYVEAVVELMERAKVAVEKEKGTLG